MYLKIKKYFTYCITQYKTIAGICECLPRISTRHS